MNGKNDIKLKATELLDKYFWFSFDRVFELPHYYYALEFFDEKENILICGNYNDLSLHLLDCTSGKVDNWLDLQCDEIEKFFR